MLPISLTLFSSPPLLLLTVAHPVTSFSSVYKGGSKERSLVIDSRFKSYTSINWNRIVSPGLRGSRGAGDH